MGLLKKFRKKKLLKKLQIKHKGSVFIKGKKTPIVIKKATINFSDRNRVLVGHQVGSGKFTRKFSSAKKAEAYSSKLLKLGKGLEGKGENRGVSLKPLYLGRSFRFLKEMKIKRR